MGALVVPMSPEFLPEAALLLAGVFAGVLALRFLFARQPSNGMKAGAISITCIILAFVLAGTHSSVRSDRAANARPARRDPLALLPAAKDSIEKGSEPTPSMSLLLGDVLLRVAPSNRYVLSVDGKQFLELDSLQTGLIVGCVVAAHDETAAAMGRNTFPFRRTDTRPSRVDAHTLRIQEEGKDIFRVHYAKPCKIEVTGSFFLSKREEPSVISFENGIRWSGGSIQPGTTVDLSHQGKGRIDFERSGLIRILHHP